MPNKNFIFIEKKEFVTEIDVQKSHDGSKNFKREVMKTLVIGFYNGRPIVGAVLKFGPRFTAQEQELMKQDAL